jgi:hypothetical protein
LSAHLLPAFLKTAIRTANACDERGVRAEAISLPIGFNMAILPLAIQLVGRLGDEAAIIALAAESERARLWAGQASSDGALKVCC